MTEGSRGLQVDRKGKNFPMGPSLLMFLITEPP